MAYITRHRQIAFEFFGTDEALIAIHNAQDAAQAITMIKDQGEGTSTSPDSPMSNGTTELAHYYKFAEIFYGKTLIQGSDGQWTYTGTAIPQVPKEDYEQSRDFDIKFTELLNTLQSAWAPGETNGDTILGNSIQIMQDLTALATTLMPAPLPSGQGNYTPDFRLISNQG